MPTEVRQPRVATGETLQLEVRRYLACVSPHLEALWDESRVDLPRTVLSSGGRGVVVTPVLDPPDDADDSDDYHERIDDAAHEDAQPYHLVYPPSLRDWPPLASFRDWLRDEIDASLNELHPPTKARKARKSA